MPKSPSSTKLETILRLFDNFPGGASIGEIDLALQELPQPLHLPRSTLANWLRQLVRDNRLRLEGQRKAARYYLVSNAISDSLPSDASSAGLEVSPEAASLRLRVHQPLHLRKPVTYSHAFLESYQPNVTEYLSSAIRHRLAARGQTPDGQQPAGTYARQIFDRLLIDLSWNSSRLEGNTYSRLETERLLQLGEHSEGKDAEDTQMILNHKAAIEMLVEDAQEIGFNRYTILNLHSILADNLLPDPGAGGRLRQRPVDIGGSVYTPLAVPQLINEYFEQILTKATAIEDPFEQAFFAMVHLPYLQPFEDVNKRVSRLAANIPLIRLNLCPLAFVDVPERDYIDGLLAIYELNRIELMRDVFVWAYERSCERYVVIRQSLGEPDRFRLRYRLALKDMVGEVVRQNLNRQAARRLIQSKAVGVPKEDRSHLIELAEIELDSLHEGNFARYRIRPSEFAAWQRNWH